MTPTEPVGHDRTLAIVIGQAALLIVSGLLFLAASVLFAALMTVEAHSSLQIIALLNAGLFYIWGMGIFGKIIKTWKTAYGSLVPR